MRGGTYYRTNGESRRIIRSRSRSTNHSELGIRYSGRIPLSSYIGDGGNGNGVNMVVDRRGRRVDTWFLQQNTLHKNQTGVYVQNTTVLQVLCTRAN